MNSSILWLILGSAIGLYIGYYHWRYGAQVDKRHPKKPFPHQWRSILQERVPFYQRLNSARKTEFEKRVHIFLLNVEIVGIDTTVDHIDRILVASGAIIPIFGFEKWHYTNLQQVQIYPDKFPIPGTDTMARGIVGWGAMEGKMLLSKKALRDGFDNQNDQINVVIHEFVHILDKQDGQIDGVLDKLMNEIDIQPWLQIIHQKMSDIQRGDSSIRKYGAANKAEFLAVVSEFFFESPEKMKSEHPVLYSALNSFYNPKADTRVQSSRERSYW